MRNEQVENLINVKELFNDLKFEGYYLNSFDSETVFNNFDFLCYEDNNKSKIIIKLLSNVRVKISEFNDDLKNKKLKNKDYYLTYINDLRDCFEVRFEKIINLIYFDDIDKVKDYLYNLYKDIIKNKIDDVNKLIYELYEDLYNESILNINN